MGDHGVRHGEFGDGDRPAVFSPAGDAIAVLMKSLAVIALGAVASFLAYVVVTLKTSPDVHGRYLLGLYLCVLVVISTVSISDDPPASGGWRNAMHVGIPILGHALTFAFVISRYF